MNNEKLIEAIKVIAESMINNVDYFETTVEINNTIVKLFIEAEFKRREN
jgi:hypothetical protein